MDKEHQIDPFFQKFISYIIGMSRFLQCATFSIHTIVPSLKPQQLFGNVPALNVILLYLITLYYGLLQSNMSRPS